MFRFPWGDMHSLNLGWFLQKFNELREDWATAEAGIDGALDAEIQKAEDALSDVFDARDAAAASATAAASSASAANTSKTAAQNSATAAASSATLANQKATAAGLSEAAAAQSATAASNSATAAATSETAAGNSASAAGNSASAAAGSATAAGNSATAAAGSAAVAEASAQRAEEVEESIPEDYTELSNHVNQLETEIAQLCTPFLRTLQTGNNYILYFKGQNGFTNKNFKQCRLTFEITSERSLSTAGCGLLVSTVNANNSPSNNIVIQNITQEVISPNKFTFTVFITIQKNYINAILDIYTDDILYKRIIKTAASTDRAGIYAVGIYSNISASYIDYNWNISGELYEFPSNLTPLS